MIEEYAGIEIIQPELAESFTDTSEDAYQQTKKLLSQHPEGALDAIHVSCWSSPTPGIIRALREAGRTDVIVTAVDASPDALMAMTQEGSPLLANVSTQPHLIGSTTARNLARYLAGETLPLQTIVDIVPISSKTEAKSALKQM